jgi:hypothetical protein
MRVKINENNFIRLENIGLWFRVFGYGLSIFKDDGYLTFSQRNGYKWYMILLGYKIVAHKPSKSVKK